MLWFHDVRHPLNRSRQVSGFHTPVALNEMLTRDFDAELGRLGEIPMNERMRPYQCEANEAIEQAIRDRKRKMLVAMATGTGKTMMTVHEVYRLMKSGVARRVLFLVDRRALAAQTVRAFASFEAEPGLKFDKLYEVYSQRFQRGDFEDEKGFDPKVLPTKYLTDPKLGQAFVYVSTIQRMTINLFGSDAVFGLGDEPIDEDADKLDIPIHAFDLIVADECHRGYSSKELSVWRNTLDHFDAVKIGLTATPAAHTTAYFENIVYRYEYDRAVREGYLVDYDVVSINSNVRMNGVFLEEGAQVEAVDTMSGVKQLDLLEDERAFDSSKIEHEITAPDSNRRILEEVKKYADAHQEETGRFPKTLIFADNDLPHTSHADQLVNTARDIFGQGDAFVAKITGRVDRPLQRIREFRNRPKPVSRRLGRHAHHRRRHPRPRVPRLPAPGQVAHPLRADARPRNAEGREVPGQVALRRLRLLRRHAPRLLPEQHRDDSRAAWRQTARRSRRSSRRSGRTRTATTTSAGSSGGCSGSTSRCPATPASSSLASSLTATSAASPKTFRRCFASRLTDTMKILRDKDFQDLLVNYPRPPRTFFVASGVEDEVSSEWLIKGATGQEYKPADYLKAFETFVRDQRRPRRSDLDSALPTAGLGIASRFGIFGTLSRRHPSTSPKTTSDGRSRSRITRLSSTSSRWSSERPSTPRRSTPPRNASTRRSSG